MNESIQTAVAEIINKIHAYMRAHSESELHRQGKMFGVLIVEPSDASSQHSEKYLAAFSAKLDGTYYHDGFVPPVYEMTTPPVGTSREESQRLQRLLFANYHFANGKGETKNLLEIFADEKPIIPAEQWFDKSGVHNQKPVITLPPSGAGECCAPKLLQYALTHGLKPIMLTEFWIGASPKNELRREGCFYVPCSGRCMPILRHMLQGTEMEIFPPDNRPAEKLYQQTELIYEDSYLIVVNKPAGVLSVKGKGDEMSIADYLSAQRNGAYIQPVHRLDQDTSGLLVLAKTPEVYTDLQAYFQRRDIQKRYEAIIKPSADRRLTVADEGIIELPLLPNPYDRPRQMVDKEHGKTALTRYRVRERRADGTLFVDFYPLTGRTHQLRVHAAHPEGLNAPIVGDRLYNGEPAPRLMLHASEIAFVHPVTKEEIHFCIPSGF